MDPADILARYSDPESDPDVSSGQLGIAQVLGTLAGGVGAQSINGLNMIGGGGNPGLEGPELGEAGQRLIRAIAPAYYQYKSSPVGRAISKVGDYYDQGVQQDADLVAKYLGPEAGGVVSAAGTVAPMLIPGPGGKEKALETAATERALGDGSMLNVGLNQGQEGQAGFRTMDVPEAQRAIESTGAKVTKSSVLTPDQHSVSEPTLVASIDRPLAEPEMQSILAQTKQSAIPQRTNAGATSMHIAPGHEQIAKEQGWDTFNPDYFRNHDGSTDTQNALLNGQGAATEEAINRESSEKAAGQLRYTLHADDTVTPITGVGSADARAQPGDIIVQHGIGEGPGGYTILDRGGLPQAHAQGRLNAALARGTLQPTQGFADGGEVGTLLGGLGEMVAKYAPEAAPLAEHVQQYGGVTYSPTSGALHRTGAVTTDPASTLALDHPPEPAEIHDYLMDHQDELTDDPASVLHVTSDEQGNHFMRVGQHEPEMPQMGTPQDLIDKYLSSPKDARWEQQTASRPLDEYDRMNNPAPAPTPWTPGKQTVANPVRNAYAGIYGPTKDVVQQAAAIAAQSPENPMMKRLWGTDRQDLSDIAMGRQGDIYGEPPGFKDNPYGSVAAQNVMTPQNAQRLVDALDYVRQHPELNLGMNGWYVQDPVFQRAVDLLGPEEGAKRFAQLNSFSGMSSPRTPVDREIGIASTAHWLANSNRWSDYRDIVKQPKPDLQDADTHLYHASLNYPALSDYLETGKVGMQSPKATMYIDASGYPIEGGLLGNMTHTPVGDVHFAAGIGLHDTRPAGKTWNGSIKGPELQALTPWFRNVADRAGMEAVPAQANLWGIFSPQTGVKSGIGMPKLEMQTAHIQQLADKYGISPESARDYWITGTRPQ
jgi:hypothetical protein